MMSAVAPASRVALASRARASRPTRARGRRTIGAVAAWTRSPSPSARAAVAFARATRARTSPRRRARLAAASDPPSANVAAEDDVEVEIEIVHDASDAAGEGNHFAALAALAESAAASAGGEDEAMAYAAESEAVAARASASATTDDDDEVQNEAALPNIRMSPVPDDVSRATLWWRALKIPMYSVCVAPLVVAASLCHHWYGCVNASQFGLFALGGCLVIAWLNLSNDAWDAATGVDDDKEMDGGGKPESIVRLMGGDVHAVNKVSLLAVGCLLSGIGALVMASTVDVAGVSSNVLSMLGVAVLCGQAYQGPPFRMSYKGLGEPLCFAAFGPLATGAFCLALAAGTGGSVWVNAPLTPVLSQGGVFGAAIMVGLTTTCILFTSHFHQEAGDRAAGKMSPVVKLGLERAIRTLRCVLYTGPHTTAFAW
jgi:1,4-dihydroxy-2-naphthoate octaprenyltransferase